MRRVGICTNLWMHLRLLGCASRVRMRTTLVLCFCSRRNGWEDTSETLSWCRIYCLALLRCTFSLSLTLFTPSRLGQALCNHNIYKPCLTQCFVCVSVCMRACARVVRVCACSSLHLRASPCLCACVACARVRVRVYVSVLALFASAVTVMVSCTGSTYRTTKASSCRTSWT